MTSDREKQGVVLGRLLEPTGYEVLCDECFELLDEFVELELAGADLDRRMPGLRAHLEGCPVCREERDSLRDLLIADSRVGR